MRALRQSPCRLHPHSEKGMSADARVRITTPPCNSESLRPHLPAAALHHSFLCMQDQKTRNCLSTIMMKEIVEVIEKLEANPDVKVLILTHTGKVRDPPSIVQARTRKGASQFGESTAPLHSPCV